MTQCHHLKLPSELCTKMNGTGDLLLNRSMRLHVPYVGQYSVHQALSNWPLRLCKIWSPSTTAKIEDLRSCIGGSRLEIYIIYNFTVNYVNVKG